MLIPKTVRLGPHLIRVERTNLEREQLFGRALYDELLIQLDDKLGPSRVPEIFIHECVHCVPAAYGLNLTEEQTRTLGVGLAQMLEEVLDRRFET